MIYNMAADFDGAEFLNRTVIGEIQLPGQPVAVHIENADGCEGIPCNAAVISEHFEMIPPKPHSHLVVATDNGIPEIEAVFKQSN